MLKGLEESMGSGQLAGFPVVDVTATLIDGSYHEVDSSALAFQIAARGAFREAMSKCGARLLEPVMKVGFSRGVSGVLKCGLGSGRKGIMSCGRAAAGWAVACDRTCSQVPSVNFLP